MSDYTDPPHPNPECRRCEGKGRWWVNDYYGWQPCRCGPPPLSPTPEMQAERDRIARIILRESEELAALPTVRDALRAMAGAIQDPEDNGWDYQ